MKKIAIFTLSFLSLLPAVAQRKASLDTGWKFHRGDVVNAEVAEFDDTKWRTLTVPHDFSMEPAFDPSDERQRWTGWSDMQVGPFSRLSVGNWDTGQTVGGTGWYRKTFILPIQGNATLDTYLSQTNVNIRFDGVYNQAEVWVNGVKAAVNVYGYMPFVVNLNKILSDAKNRRVNNEPVVTVAVKALNEGLNSRWYAGSGIFRHVWLETTEKLHLDEWDTYVDGSELMNKGKDANVKVFAKVFNEDTRSAMTQFCVDILDAAGNTVAHEEKEFTVSANNTAGADVAVELPVKTPRLWSVEDPYRYTAKVYVCKSGEEKDALYIPFGIRTLHFSAEEGFLLNGKPTKLRGGCVHHDNGLLGTAAIDRAEVRKVELLKAQGYNAVRCSHNLPSEAFLNACDSLGMLVIDEVFDQWEEPKRSNDYSQYFTRDHMKDMALMVRRDRNHPSIIMWSIGNEEAQRCDPRGKEIALELNLAANGQDHTRPTTMAVCSFWDRPGLTWENDSPRAFDNIEVGGYNYEWKHYEADHDSFPDRIMYGSESVPNEMAQNWNLVNQHPYIIGDFVWTAIDYIGEAGLGHTHERSDNQWIQLLSWPWFNAWCGDLDLIGDKKPQSYYRDVLWNRSTLAMAVRPSVPDGEREVVGMWGWTAEENHWNWSTPNSQLSIVNSQLSIPNYLPIELRPENYQTANIAGNMKHNVNAHRSDSLRVNVYSREPRVRLLINDSIMGEKDTDPETYTATFTVAYEPGSLKAMTVPQAKKAKVDSLEFVTALQPARLTLKADRDVIAASHNDLSYIQIGVEDEEGHLCPTAEIPIEITVYGDAQVVAGTGHPYDMHSFRSLHPTTFRGKALAIVQPLGKPGEVTLVVKAKGLEEAQITIEMR